MSDPYRILALDGGGVRGVLTATVLGRLEAATDFMARTDLVAGTSTGGILALGIAAGFDPGKLVALYRDHADEIFSRSWLSRMRSGGNLFGAQYKSRNLERVLRRYFGETTLGQLRRRVLVPTFDLDNESPGRRTWKPKFYHNLGQDDLDERVVDVALRTSAAPTYFPTHQGYIDGGAVANNPSMCALAQALDLGTGRRDLEDVRLLSVGSGESPQYVEGQSLNWGLARWAKLLVPIMTDGVTGVADYECRRILGDRYHRLQPMLEKPIGLDDANLVPTLIRVGKSVRVAGAEDWLRGCGW